MSVSETVWYSGEHIRKSDRDAQSAMDHDGNVLDYPAAAEREPDASYNPVHNRFQDATDYMHTDATILTRGDWANTQPTAPEAKALSEEYLNKIMTFDYENDPVLGNQNSLISTDVMPVSKADNGLTLSNMRGLSFYDETSWTMTVRS